MCGIVGYTGKTACVPELLAGLESLAYRGYDSAGVAVYDGTEIQLAKAQGHLANLEALLKEHPIPGRCGIGHTRWATHGEPSYVNAHPHTDDAKQIALVHNGIIENYQKLKQMLIGKGCEFVSETDTEVVAQLVGSLYTGDCLAAVTAAMRLLEGSFALAILFRDEPYTIYCCSKDSPMVVGHGDAESFVASDIPALLPHTRDVYFMEDRQIALLRVDGIAFYNEFGQPIEKKSTHVDWDVEAAKKGNFEHYMMKEICEEPVAFRKTLEQYVSKKDGRLKADMFPWDAEEAAALKGLTIVSCGTAFHAALLGKKFVERLAGIPVQVEIASEFRYGDPMLHSGDSLMVISQSGETADTIAALRLAKSRNCRTIAVCNVIGSTIARDAETVLFTYAGPEIAVAATKSYLTQLAVLYLTALDLAEKRGTMSEQDVHKRIDELFALPGKMQQILDHREQIQCFASKAFSVRHVFFIGRGIDYALSMEAALKLKEISYIHSEAYAAGELKHGTIALIEEGSLVVALATQPALIKKTSSNMEEVRVRGAHVLAVTNGESEEAAAHSDEQWAFPQVEETLTPFVAILPMQLIAYYMAVQKGCSVDRPRNLAKSVTVE
ncbi:MAG: glutamine--fructose-6-phosphate transaminase (isomerizing) [Clostridium sp.]|nr:glutamine--fructose-6-phosphate transaminase (isomerizing) [Clostridium sp.]MDD7140155.1 glutamine--fructose-6-phosphate transaminase (isomerizing) [Clostridium sp.]MDY6080903.1 glutamine--fructose-6-phosphate transaminase (isomerizing) [Eubacteriales bacterium]